MQTIKKNQRWSWLTKPWIRLYRFLFGVDIFISYSRKNSVYAERLANRLREMDFSCYLDQYHSEPGSTNVKTITTSLKNASLFVVLATRSAARSAAVADEVEGFLQTRRVFVPINFGFYKPSGEVQNEIVDGPLEDDRRVIVGASWFEKISGLAITDESLNNLAVNEPSALVIKRIENSFIYQKQSRRLRMTTLLTVALLVLMIASIVLSTYQTIEIQRKNDSLATKNDSLQINVHSLNARSTELEGINQKNQEELGVLNDSIKETDGVLRKTSGRLQETNGMLVSARKNLKLAVTKEDAARKHSEIFNYLSQASYNDIRNQPAQSYRYASKAYGMEADSIPHTISAILISKALNRGTPRLVNVHAQVENVAIIRDHIFSLGVRSDGTCVIHKMGLDGIVTDSLVGIYRGMAVSKKNRTIYTGEYVRKDSSFYLCLLDESFREIKKIKLKPLYGDGWPAGNYDVKYISEIKLSPDEKFVAISGYAHWGDISNVGYRFRIYLDAVSASQHGHVYLKNDFEGIDEQSSIRFLSGHQVLADGRNELLVDDIQAATRTEIGRHKSDTRDSYIETYDCNPARTRIAMGGSDHEITVLKRGSSAWEPEKMISLPGDAKVNKIVFLDDRHVAVVRTDFTVNVINIDPSPEDRNVVSSYGHIDWQNPDRPPFTGHTGEINKVIYAPGSYRVATCSEDKTIRIWNIKDGSSQELIGSERPVKDIVFDEAANFLVSGGSDEMVRIWDLRYQKELIADPTKTEFFIDDYHWDGLLRDGMQLTALILRKAWGFVNYLEISADGRYLYQGTYNDKFNIYKDQELVRTLKMPSYGSVVLTCGGRYLMAALSDHAYIFYNTLSADSFKITTKHEISDNSFSTDGRWIEMRNNKPLVHAFDDLRAGTTIGEGIISADGNFYLQFSKDMVDVWDLKKNVHRSVRCSAPIYNVAFSPAGTFVLVETLTRYQIIPLASYLPVTINIPDTWKEYCFSPDDKQVAIAGKYGDFWIYDVVTGKSENYSKHGRGIYSLAFSPKGDWIASGSRDRTVRFWNVQTKDFVEYKFLNPVDKVVYAPDGNVLFVNSGIATYKLIAPTAEGLFSGEVSPVNSMPEKRFHSSLQR